MPKILFNIFKGTLFALLLTSSNSTSHHAEMVLMGHTCVLQYTLTSLLCVIIGATEQTTAMLCDCPFGCDRLRQYEVICYLLS